MRFRRGHARDVFNGMGDAAFPYRALPIEERLRLVEDIWDSIAEEANMDAAVLPLTEAQLAELGRRIAEADSHPEDTLPR